MAQLVTRGSEDKADKKPADAAKKTAAKAADSTKKPTGKAAEPMKKPAKPAAAPAKEKPAEQVEAVEPARKATQAKPAGSSIPYRIGAIMLWVLAIGFELLAIMALMKNFTIQFTSNGDTNMWIILIGAIVLDMTCAIIAAQLWKKANRIKPMSKKNKFLFYLWNELGVVMACICFIPLIILLIKNDKLDKKTKIIVTSIAAAALLITGLASADFNPIAKEDVETGQEAFGDTDVYWTRTGHVFHLDKGKCYHIKTRDYYVGTFTEATQSGKSRVCSYCKDHAKEWGTSSSIVEWINKTYEQTVTGGQSTELPELEPTGETVEDAELDQAG